MKLYAMPEQTAISLETLTSRLGKVVSLVGAGGKSTWLYALAEAMAGEGKRVLVTTSTRIYLPEAAYFAMTPKEVRHLWEKGTFAVIGMALPEQGKLTMPEASLLEEMMKQADITLIEADGSRHYPVKAPRSGEPVILPQSDTVIAVMGMSALGKPLEDCCFGLAEARQLLNAEENHRLTAEDAALLLASPFGGRKAVENRGFLVMLNQCEEGSLAQAAAVSGALKEQGIRDVYASCFSQGEREYYAAIGQRR